MREFGFSEIFIRETRRIVMVLLLCMIPFGLVFTMFLPDFKIEKALPAVGIVFVGSGIIFAIESFFINRRQRKLKVFIYEDKLVKQCGKKTQTILWKDLERIKIAEKKNGGVAQISFYPMKSKMRSTSVVSHIWKTWPV